MDNLIDALIVWHATIFARTKTLSTGEYPRINHGDYSGYDVFSIFSFVRRYGLGGKEQNTISSAVWTGVRIAVYAEPQTYFTVGVSR